MDYVLVVIQFGIGCSSGVILSEAKNLSECFDLLDASPLSFHL